MCLLTGKTFRIINHCYLCFVMCCAVNSIDLSTLLFMGDQLTVERARNVIKSRVNANSPAEALEGLQPAICDWHAECVLLQVYNICNTYVLYAMYIVYTCLTLHP